MENTQTTTPKTPISKTPKTLKIYEVYKEINNTVFEFSKKKTGQTKGWASYKYFNYSDSIDPLLHELRKKDIVITYQTFFEYSLKVLEKAEGGTTIYNEQIPNLITTKVVLESPIEKDGKIETGVVLLRQSMPFGIEVYETKVKISPNSHSSYETSCSYEKAVQSKLTFHERSTLLRFLGFHDESETGFEQEEHKLPNPVQSNKQQTPPKNNKEDKPPLDDKKITSSEDLMKQMLSQLK